VEQHLLGKGWDKLFVHRIRQRTMYPPSIDKQAFVDMANDRSIQQELHHIAAEFAQADFDGLDEEKNTIRS